MIDRTTKLRWRRSVRRRQRQIEDISSQTEEHLDKHFFRRLGRLYEVRRFIVSWVLLVVLLVSAVVIQTRALGDYYLETVPVAGGIYSEGIIGSYTNANPIYASSEVDGALSELLFAGLFTQDSNNQFVGDMAESLTVDETAKIYTVILKENLFWHDGTPLTARDVVFTYSTIQNPDARSPLFASWQGVKVEALDERIVQFSLPNVLASFQYSLTNGIVPSHKLQTIEPNELRGSLFNTVEPVGSGPFKWKDVEVYGDTAENREQRIALSAFDDYHGGKPKLNEFIIRAYLDEEMLIESFERGELNAVAGQLSTQLSGEPVYETPVPLTGSVTVFFRTSQDILKDPKLRKALTHATNREVITKGLLYPSTTVDAPLLQEHIGYDPVLTQYGFSIDEARRLLDEAGWVLDPATNKRSKAGVSLTLKLNTLSSAEYASVANQLQTQWGQVGVDLEVTSLAQRDLQTVIDERSYDVLIYGIVMGQDADQFAYWHSTQADIRSQRRLNFSDYSSKTVDSALEAGRTRIDPKLRAAKYAPFLQSWREDAPAITLYRPRFLYTTYGKVYNFNAQMFNTSSDRFYNVQEWMIRTDRALQ
jgi:peptide/nickel transport system substrate-binding protein